MYYNKRGVRSYNSIISLLNGDYVIQAVLENIKMLKDSKEGNDWWNRISKAEKEGIDEGLADSEAGRSTPHEEVRKEYEKWL